MVGIATINTGSDNPYHGENEPLEKYQKLLRVAYNNTNLAQHKIYILTKSWGDFVHVCPKYLIT